MKRSFILSLALLSTSTFAAVPQLKGLATIKIKSVRGFCDVAIYVNSVASGQTHVEVKEGETSATGTIEYVYGKKDDINVFHSCHYTDDVDIDLTSEELPEVKA
jgi:hypothetical protein